ncbi:c-type cytochrome [Mesorhizobium xinjiangense]|uniref:c-type cytochrome n=1 Tax=Mesorhizobium xinjiangense TaxID=2678685 RepID=UPI002E252BEA
MSPVRIPSGQPRHVKIVVARKGNADDLEARFSCRYRPARRRSGRLALLAGTEGDGVRRADGRRDDVSTDGAGAGGALGFCAACHGDDAGGRDGIGPPLVHIIYEPNHHSDAAFLLAARSGVRQHHWGFGDMPPVAEVEDAEIAAIVAYVRALQRANGIR